MNKGISIILIFFIPVMVLAQQPIRQNQQASIPPGANTYAVVIGISTYENIGIEKLDFAHKDAEAFAQYLQSSSGGKVPATNIRLLLNEKATHAAIYESLYWLLNVCRSGDLVYVYFSGHGDMENETIYKLGFLLAYNTPRTNYINNSLRIEDLNNIANTLSVNVKARVVLITDACHSGKISGNENRGMHLFGRQRQAVLENEIRMASCADDQLSVEDIGWGGGRGVFSYYLINGLMGKADLTNDGKVSVDEIKKYLDSSLSNDPILTRKRHKQHPVINGKAQAILALVDKPVLINPIVSSNPVNILPPISKQPQAYFFEATDRNAPENIFDFAFLKTIPKQDIASACINAVLEKTNPDSTTAVQLAALKRNIANNPDALNRFNNSLMVLFADRSQQVINLYLEGDDAEMERRNYYSLNNSGYQNYPDMLETALRLSDTGTPMYHSLEVKLHYFSGVLDRLKIPTVADRDALVRSALGKQLKALSLENNAAYIHNELGNLYMIRNKYDSAKYHYTKASEISPGWVIPWSNMINLYSTLHQYNLAVVSVEQAEKINPDFKGLLIPKGILYARSGNGLFAEEMMHRSIEQNAAHYLPYEWLGMLYTQSQQYELAETFFIKAENRKAGLAFAKLDINTNNSPFNPIIVQSRQIHPCFIDSNKISTDDAITQFLWAMHAHSRGQSQVAEKRYKNILAKYPTHPLAYHYLGELLNNQKRLQEAEAMYSLALKNSLDKNQFQLYTKKAVQQFVKQDACLLNEFSDYHYEKSDDLYKLARVQEALNRTSDAEKNYRKLIRENSRHSEAYYRLWTMLEKADKIYAAEDVIHQWATVDMISGSNELNFFYTRMQMKYPDAWEWYYKAGVALHNLVLWNEDMFKHELKSITRDSIGVTVSWKPSDTDDTEMQELFPVIEGDIVKAPGIFSPRKEGIRNFIKALELVQKESDYEADIVTKTGDLYASLGLPGKAIPFYSRYTVLKPADGGNREKLADVCIPEKYFREALLQLDYLQERKELSIDKQILLAGLYIRAGRYPDADKLLKDVTNALPVPRNNIMRLKAQSAFMAGRWSEAISLFKELLKTDPENISAVYGIASSYARLGKKTEAFTWLETSFQKGFRYRFVLDYDSNWNDLRKTTLWKEKVEDIIFPMPASTP